MKNTTNRSLGDKNNNDVKHQNSDLDILLTNEFLQSEAIQRLSNREFWNIFKKHFNISGIEEFGSHCYDLLEAYIKALEGKIERAMQKALQTKSTKKLQFLRGEIETYIKLNGYLRFSLRGQEGEMNGMLKGIDKTLKELGAKPESAFYGPKFGKIIEDVKCPYCKKINKNFEYGLNCQYCRELIATPWKEHTVCPGCNSIINRYDIFKLREDYELDSNNNLITCPYCRKRFNWKKYREQPETFGIKHCIFCDRTYDPDKRNWKKQRLCPKCKEKGIDPYYLDHPDYQKKYREKEKK